MPYVLAVLAACANAAASVLQRKANRDQPRRDNLSWRLIANLIHERAWLAGVAAVTVGFLLQATALGIGTLALVQPILVLELPATLLLAARVFSARLGRREWGPIVAMTAGLAALLYFLSPGAGRPHIGWIRWLVGSGLSVAVIAGLAALGRRGPAGTSGDQTGGEARQTAVLGVAAGAAFGLTAAYMKGMTSGFRHGIVGVLDSWQLYAMIAAGTAGMFLLQSALNAGRLIAAQPGITLSDPIVAILWGVVGFHETVRTGWHIVFAAVAAALIAAAVIVLARSAVLAGPVEEHH